MTDDEINEWFPIASKVFKINVYAKDEDVTWESLYRSSADRADGELYVSPIETFYGSLKSDLRDANGNNLFIETVVNGNSDFIYVKFGDTFTNFAYVNSTAEVSALPNGTNSTTDEDYVKFTSTATTGSGTNRLAILSGGTSVQDTGLTGATDGYKIFEDRENVDVQILIGTSYDTAQKQEIARIAATRADCIATVQAGELDHDSTTDILATEVYGYRTPSYVAIYAGYSKVYDQYNDKFVFLPNSIMGAALMARTDNIANPWDAPAGTTRGILSVLDQRKVFTFDEIGKLYDRNVNVPKWIRGTGHVMWGQKTAQLKSSALDRINVRRLLLYIENNVETALLPFLFENNTARTRLRVFSLVDEFLAGVQSGGGVTSYKVVVDETNNTAAVIDANRLAVDLYVAPSRTIEYIQLRTIVTRTGISFDEIQL
ncbi:MAG: phage tail sheath C-terminal domain-containing protein [bacterium]